MNNKLLMGLGKFVIGLRACCLAVQLVIGNFSCFRPNGGSWGFPFNYFLWGKGLGFLLCLVRVEGCPKYWIRVEGVSGVVEQG